MMRLPLRCYLRTWKETEQASMGGFNLRAPHPVPSWQANIGLTSWKQTPGPLCLLFHSESWAWHMEHSIFGKKKKKDARCPEHEAAEGSVSPAGRPPTLPVWAVYTWTFVFPFSFCVSILILALHHLNRDDLKVDHKRILCLFEKGLLGKFFCNQKFKKYSSSFPANHFYLLF